MRAQRWLTALALAAAGSFAAWGAGTPGEEQCTRTVRLLSEQYRTLKSLKAHFRHNLKAPALNQEELEEGTLYLAQGGRMRWEYTSPEGKLAVADGKTNLLYLPMEKQVYVQTLETGEKAPLAIRLLTGQVDLLREVRCRSAEAAGGEVVLGLDLVAGDAGVQGLEVTFDTVRSIVTRVRYKDALGNEVSVTLSAVETGLSLQPTLFEFKIPEGVQVVKGE